MKLIKVVTFLFKWNGNWQTIINHVSKHDIDKYFGKPVTSERNLGVWTGGVPKDCQIGDYVIKNKNGYGVIKNEKAKSRN